MSRPPVLAAAGLFVLLTPAAYADQNHQDMNHSQMQVTDYGQMPGSDHSSSTCPAGSKPDQYADFHGWSWTLRFDDIW